MPVLLEPANLTELNDLDPESLLQWAAEWGPRAAIITSFQNTGCVLIDMAGRVAPELRVLTIDTLRLHRETYQAMRAIEERYCIAIERFQPDPVRLEAMLAEHGEYLFFDSGAKQRLCCQVRKVEPNQRALESVDVWITGLRRDQSSARRDVPTVSIVKQQGREIVKIAPVAAWSEDQVWDYIREHDVPVNALYDRGYTSIGCEICTTPTRAGEDKRAGRWRWMNQFDAAAHKECGIHVQGSGI